MLDEPPRDVRWVTRSCKLGLPARNDLVGKISEAVLSVSARNNIAVRACYPCFRGAGSKDDASRNLGHFETVDVTGKTMALHVCTASTRVNVDALPPVHNSTHRRLVTTHCRFCNARCIAWVTAFDDARCTAVIGPQQCRLPAHFQRYQYAGDHQQPHKALFQLPGAPASTGLHVMLCLSLNLVELQ